MDNFLKTIREETEKRYNKKGIFKSNVKLDPKTLVDDLEMSTRLKKILKKHYVENVESLNKLKPLDYCLMKGMGARTLTELETFNFRFQLGVHSSEN